MGCRWLCSSARRTPARLRASSIATSPRSTGIPASSCPTAARSSGSSATCSGACRRCSGGGSGRSTIWPNESCAARRTAAGPPQPLQRSLVLRGSWRPPSSTELAASARFGGFADALGDALAELAAALVEPEEVGRRARAPVRRLPGGARPARVAGIPTRCAGAPPSVAPVSSRRWNGSPVFVYGFEDLTGAQWALLEALVGPRRGLRLAPLRARPPGVRGSRADGTRSRGARRPAVDELPAQSWYESPTLAHLERVLFEDAMSSRCRSTVRCASSRRRARERRSSSSARRSSGCSATGVAADEIGVVVPSVESRRAPLETAFGSLGVPYAVEGSVRLARTPFGRALLGLLRFAFARGGRADLYAFLRFSVLGAPALPGRLCGGPATRAGGERRPNGSRRRRCGCSATDRPSGRLGPHPLIEGVRALAAAMLRAAWGLERPPVEGRAGSISRPRRRSGVVRTSSRPGTVLGGSTQAPRSSSALEQPRCRPRAREPGRVVVLDPLRARTRRFGSSSCSASRRACCLGGLSSRRSWPRDAAASSSSAAPQARGSSAPNPIARDRYLFYTACTRAWRRLYLVREAATEDGRPLEASPFYDEVRSRVQRRTSRAGRAAAAVRALLGAASSPDRARASALGRGARLRAGWRRPLAASAGGWSRQLDRALGSVLSGDEARQSPGAGAAPRADVDSRSPSSRRSATARRCGSSSGWSTRRPIDAEVDPRLRGRSPTRRSTGSTRGCPSASEPTTSTRLGSRRPSSSCTNAWRRRSPGRSASSWGSSTCSSSRARSAVTSSTSSGRTTRGLPLVPRRFEVSFGTERAAPELQRGIDLDGFTVSGKIDRIDVDPFSARGIVQDYKSGDAHSARRIESDGRLQVPLYVLALRDLVGIEPLGGLYRSLSGEREARGLLRSRRTATSVPGFASLDYLDEDAFWGVVDAGRRNGRATRSPGSVRATSATIRAPDAARPGATAGRSVGWRGRDAGGAPASIPSSSLRSTSQGSSSSRPAQGPGRRLCSSSATSRPLPSGASRSTPCS